MAPSYLSTLQRWGFALALGLFAVAQAAVSVKSTVLIFAPDTNYAFSGYSGLQGYGIPYQVVIVPSTGITLPQLNSSATLGNYGAIVVLAEVSYDYNGTYNSALTTAQWQTLYNYQTSFGVRMVRLDVYPGPDFGCTALGGTSADQAISISNATAFPTANLKTGAQVSTAGLYHYPASITNASIAWEVAQFAAGGGFSQSTAAIINQFGTRQQMVWFLPFATDWSATSAFLQHAWIHWATRGFYGGFRRLYFSTQIDDMFLETDIYLPNGTTFRIRPADLAVHKAWMPTVQAKMPAGSFYMVEIGYNGNGNIEASIDLDTKGTICKPNSAIEYADQIDTALEFQKPLGTGTNIWPKTPTSYTWSQQCAMLDPLMQWWANTSNRDAFMHISHTFTHEALNNATKSDATNEIVFNQAWMKQVGISAAKNFSANGLIPPAITGLHNGDAINAWMANGITHVVGDNTRPVLLNPTNTFWPLISNVSANGYAGLTIMPRWATNIYYNCYSSDCTTQEWINTSAGSGDFQALLADARATNSRNLLGLHHDPFMFHQANLRQTDVAQNVVNGASVQMSLLQCWVETVVNEMARLVTWPMITLKHDDLAVKFINRMTLDACNPLLTYTYSSDMTHITGATLSTNGNTCGTTVPVTFPGTVSSTTASFTTEQIGSDPLTYWVTMGGKTAPTFTLTNPISVL